MEGLISTNMDRISQLPEPIIHQILSHLNSKDAAHTGFLSKSLLNAWSTRPVLDFDISCPNGNFLKCHIDCLNDNFMNCLLKSLQLYDKKRLPLQKFKLHIKGPQDEKVGLHFYDFPENYCLHAFINIALSKGIVELDLSINYFRLPFTHKDPKWSNLKKLKLQYLPLDNRTLSYMISSFPLLTYLLLEECQGLEKNLSLKIPYLREFYLICTKTHWIRKVIISAPKLESFKSTHVEVVDIDEGTRLKSLSISYSTMEQVRFQHLLSRCLFLDDLSLTWCKKIKTLVVSSHSLKFMKLKECHNLHTIDIDAPNLQLLEFINRNTINSLPFVISRAAINAKCCSITYWRENGWWDQDQSIILNQLMTNFQSSSLTVQSSFNHKWSNFVNKLNHDPKSFQYIDENHMESLTLRYSTDINKTEMEGFLQICRPKYVICEYLDVYYNHEIMRKLCVDLWRLNKHSDEIYRFNGCWRRFDRRCWRHHVKEAKICYVVGNEHKPLTNYERKSLSTAAAMMGKVKISFALDWKESS